MNNREEHSGLREAAVLGGVLLGMALNVVAAWLLAPHLPLRTDTGAALFIIAIFGGGGICGGVGLLWAERYLEGRE